MLPAARLFALLSGAALLGLLHLLPSSDVIDPVRRTISEYALGPDKWLFDLSVLLVAAGSAGAFGMLVARGLVRAASATTLFGGLWVAGLATVTLFEKTDWSVGPSLGGTIHRYASIVAFVALPLAVLSCAGAALPASRPLRGLARLLATTSLLWFGVILGAVALMLAGGEPWWRAIPPGLVERFLAGGEVLALAVLLYGSLRPANSSPNPPPHLIPS
ncbi:hypothetical protein FHU38_002154 [Saccharomonospora amisosensis]|uniref:DUF998 domain-containing protein n=1 Tax=Saccharomonospora amisosensis TaxID=1128677 RepID=A0A7X5UPJ0_9PSEU|nr:DUF998 domain-containing protein [Saccharomonospora amisosensis]NIJ11810.1 hypothetical protein [Saccharomonospora amisosensis]